MMNPATPAMRQLALWLLAQEVIESQPSDKTNATFRVCEKLRGSLTTLMGTAGYRSLIVRALTLAKKEAPSLENVQVKEDGSPEWTGALEPREGRDHHTKGEAVLVAQLLGLLMTFIGQTLTLRLVRDLWPHAPFEDMNSETEKQL